MTVLTANERRLVPRWRSFRTTLTLGELATTRGLGGRALWEMAMTEARNDWLRARDLESAIEFVSTAALLDRLDNAQDAVDYVLRTEGLPPLVQQSTILNLDDKWEPLPDGDAERIAHTRAALRVWPRDAVLWTDLALLYCGQGLDKKAGRALVVALALAPSNRYVLRCATRFYIHTNDPEQAVGLLRRSRRARHDPWLASAEIAASQVADRPPMLAQVGRRLLDSASFADREVTELATSIGTLEIESGKVRRARKLFEQSAKSPNDNVKAQFQWVAKEHHDAIPTRTIELDDEHDHEAQALAYARVEDWLRTMDYCNKWGADEFFSDRPFNFGSYIAIEALGDAKTAEGFAKRGLRANRRDVYLLNNLAVSLAMQSRTDEAERLLKVAKRNSSNTGEEAVMLRATEGMIRFRQGELDSGRRGYEEAILLAMAQKDQDSARRAAVYYVAEEVAAKTPESGMLSKLVLAREGRLEPETRQLARRIRNASRGVPSQGSIDQSPSVTEIVSLLRGDMM